MRELEDLEQYVAELLGRIDVELLARKLEYALLQPVDLELRR